VEAYLEKAKPALRDDSDALLDLIYHEGRPPLGRPRGTTVPWKNIYGDSPIWRPNSVVQFESSPGPIEGGPSPDPRSALSPMGQIVAEDRTNLPTSGSEVTFFRPSTEILDELGPRRPWVLFYRGQTDQPQASGGPSKLIPGRPPRFGPGIGSAFAPRPKPWPGCSTPTLCRSIKSSEYDGCLCLSLETGGRPPTSTKKFGGVPQPGPIFAAQLVETLAGAGHALCPPARALFIRDLRSRPMCC